MTKIVSYNDKIYMDTGKEIPVEIDDTKVLGSITSSVKSTEMPAHNGESNFGCEGAQYAFYDDGLVVLLKDKWIFFEEDMESAEEAVDFGAYPQDFSPEQGVKYIEIYIQKV